MFKYKFAIIALLAGLQSVFAEKNTSFLVSEIAQVKIDQKGDQWTVRVPLSRPTTFAPKFLSAQSNLGFPDRYYVDIADAHLPKFVRPPAIPKGSPISGIRLGQNTLYNVRVVLDLEGQFSEDDLVTSLVDKEIVIEVKTSASTKLAGAKNSNENEVIFLRDHKELNRRSKIVIDAGHGGEDIGAKGRKGTLEKDVTLSIAKKLNEFLSRKSQYEIFMTRNEDRTLSLQDRTNFANRIEGDLFISIHANASPKSLVRGVSTYFLDNADDQESLRVAMRENGELAPQIDTGKEISEQYFLEVMKASMIKNFHTAQSTDLARSVQSSLINQLKQKHRHVEDLGVRSAGFYVLTGAKMPAILVETAFISNLKEERLLNHSGYQQLVVRAIAEGIDHFFKKTSQSHTALYHP